MTDTIPWFTALQSKARGFRPGMEITVLKGRQSGKTLIMDYESDDFHPWLRPHYVEYYDFDTGETYWKKLDRKPNMSELYVANNVIRKNEDGTYEYVKNRETGELRKLNEQETMWMLLHV